MPTGSFWHWQTSLTSQRASRYLCRALNFKRPCIVIQAEPLHHLPTLHFFIASTSVMERLVYVFILKRLNPISCPLPGFRPLDQRSHHWSHRDARTSLCCRYSTRRLHRYGSSQPFLAWPSMLNAQIGSSFLRGLALRRRCRVRQILTCASTT